MLQDWQRETGQLRWIPLSAIDAPGALPEYDKSDTQPLMLLDSQGGRYELLSGGGYLRHCRETGRTHADALVVKQGGADERISWLLDRLVTGDMHYLDEAAHYAELLEQGNMTRAELAARLGRSQSTLQKKLRLLSFEGPVRAALMESGLGERYAQLLLRVPGNQGRLRMLRHIISRGLDVKEAEELIDETLSRMPVPVPRERRLMPVMRDHRLYVNAIRGVVEQMNDAGIDAVMHTLPGLNALEVRISVPVQRRGR